MQHQILCKNCSALIPVTKFCPECGFSTKKERISLKTVVEDIVNTFFNTTNRLTFTFKSLLRAPGVCILDYVDGKRGQYQSPFSYFACSLIFYSLYKEYMMTFLYRLYVGTELNNVKTLTNDVIFNELGSGLNLETLTLVGLLVGMALIGWIICGLSWGEKNKRTFNLTESVVVFTYIYGTNFFLDPFVVSLEIPFWLQIKELVGEKNIDLVTDIPLIILIGYMAYSFCRKAKISILRYLITLIVGFFYYYYMASQFKIYLVQIDHFIKEHLHPASLVFIGLMIRKY